MSGVSRHKSSHFDYGLFLMYLKEILSIVVGLARGIEVTLITKKKTKKTDIYGVNEYRHLFIPLLSVHAFGIQHGWRPVLETTFKFQIIVHLIAWRKNKVL